MGERKGCIVQHRYPHVVMLTREMTVHGGQCSDDNAKRLGLCPAELGTAVFAVEHIRLTDGKGAPLNKD
jgi:hypothetical protein